MFHLFKSSPKPKDNTPKQPVQGINMELNKTAEELKGELLSIRARISEEKINHDDPRRSDLDARIKEIDTILDRRAANDVKYRVPENPTSNTQSNDIWSGGYTGGNPDKDFGSNGERKVG